MLMNFNPFFSNEGVLFGVFWVEKVKLGQSLPSLQAVNRRKAEV